LKIILCKAHAILNKQRLQRWVLYCFIEVLEIAFYSILLIILTINHDFVISLEIFVYSIVKKLKLSPNDDILAIKYYSSILW